MHSDGEGESQSTDADIHAGLRFHLPGGYSNGEILDRWNIEHHRYKQHEEDHGEKYSQHIVIPSPWLALPQRCLGRLFLLFLYIL